MLEVMNWTYNKQATAQEEESPRANPQFVKMVHAFSNKARSPSIDRDVEIAIILEWQTTQDADLMAQLLEAYNGFITSIAIRICTKHGRKDLMNDAWSHACELFIGACKKYDPAHGARISTLSKYHIVGGLHTFLTDQRTPVRTATNYYARRVIYNYGDICAQFKSETGRQLTTTPEDLEIASGLTGIPVKPLKRGIRSREMAVIPAHLINLPVQESSDLTLDQEDMMREILSRELAALQDVLSTRDFAIVRKSFLTELSGKSDFTPIAEEHSLTIERIRQIYRGARDLIRDNLRRQGIASFQEAI